MANLVAGGSNHSEAEQIIAARKTALNKAIREYTKETGNKLSQINFYPSIVKRAGILLLRQTDR